MTLNRRAFLGPRSVKVVAAIIIGLSVGTLLPPKSMTLPVIGAVSGIVIGDIGLIIGAVLYLWVPTLVSSPVVRGRPPRR